MQWGLDLQMLNQCANASRIKVMDAQVVYKDAARHKLSEAMSKYYVHAALEYNMYYKV